MTKAALRSAFSGSAPWDEVWFIEAHLPDRRAVWLRYVLHAGAQHEAQVWSVVFAGDRPSASVALTPLSRARHTGTTLFGSEHGRLELDVAALPDPLGRPLRVGTATGSTATASWELVLTAEDTTHELIPPALRGVGRTYTSAVSRLRLDGVIHTPHGRWEVNGARGVLGHVRGARNRARGWVWCHAELASGRFEALSAVLGTGAVHTPPLTTLRLDLDGETFAFTQPADLLLTSAQVVGDAWRFQTFAPGARLSGRLTLGPTHSAALVRYHDERGRPLWCTNHPFSRLELVLERPGSPPQRIVTDACTGEIATRTPPVLAPIAG